MTEKAKSGLQIVPGMTRRSALGSGLLVAAGSVLATGPVGAVLAADHDPDPQEQFWMDQVKQTFRIQNYVFNDREGQAKRGRLILFAAERCVTPTPDMDRPEYLRPCAVSLLFRGTGQYQMKSASYTIRHEQHGDFELFLNYIGPYQRYPRHSVYEAVLN